ARMRQLAFVSDLVSDLNHLVIMGDLNCSCDSQEIRLLRNRIDLQEPVCDQSTFPSWRPMRKIDHILVSEGLVVENARVLDYPLSDHLPIGIDVVIPEGMDLAA
ncbi:MAG: endonuclease/exonuclease/phosphatase family protein, partial [Sedimenticola sp.]